MRTLTVCLIVPALFAVASCATLRSAAPEPPPIVGNWDYEMDTPQGVYQGMLMFELTEEGLAGSITQEGFMDGVVLEELTFDEETGLATFSFDSGEFGMMDVSITIEEDAFSGLLTVLDFGADVDLVGTRAEMEEAEQ